MTSKQIAAQDAQWQAEAKNWIQTELQQQGIAVTGEIEVIHSRPWSCIMRIPSDSGSLFFKATSGLSAHEIAVVAELARLEERYLPKVLAVDAEHDWMIMRDGGQRLRETLIAQLDWKHWEELLPQYARVQQSAAGRMQKLVEQGLPNRSLAELPRLYETLLADTELYRIDLPEGLSSADYQRLQALGAVVREKVTALAAYGIPESIHHGDLHDGNIFHNGENYLFVDWGDSSFTHPFFSLRTAYVSAEIRFGLDEGSPELERLRNAYLKAWQDYGSEALLLEAFKLAESLWTIPTALNWKATIENTAAEERQEFAHIMPGLGQELLAVLSA